MNSGELVTVLSGKGHQRAPAKESSYLSHPIISESWVLWTCGVKLWPKITDSIVHQRFLWLLIEPVMFRVAHYLKPGVTIRIVCVRHVAECDLSTKDVIDI